MNVKFRNNCSIAAFGEDWHKIREFLLANDFRHYSYAQWGFWTTHANLDKSGLKDVALWEADGEIVSMVTYDSDGTNGASFFACKEGYEHLKRDMLAYAKDAFCNKGEWVAIISEQDTGFHHIAAEMGFIPMEDGQENTSIFPLTGQYAANESALQYSLPDGFIISDLEKSYSTEKYAKLFKQAYDELVDNSGFLHPTPEDYGLELNAPYVDKKLKIVVLAPNGDYAAFCGMWYDKRSSFALVEPVVTSPDYRKLGLGRAVVLEGVKRCGKLGAKEALVQASLQFYYSIGFRPYRTTTAWVPKRK